MSVGVCEWRWEWGGKECVEIVQDRTRKGGGGGSRKRNVGVAWGMQLIHSKLPCSSHLLPTF